MAEEKTELLAHIQKACLNFDDVEPVAFTKWEEMSIEELRTVAILLNDEMVMLLNAQEGARGHCYLLESLYEHIIRNARARNPLTGVQITDRQRQNILTASARLPLQTPPQAIDIRQEVRQGLHGRAALLNSYNWRERRRILLGQP